jgi:DNA invertase Pin-like site-specific DNA recombinase
MKAVAYIRVSTEDQSKSGLGLEAQISAINTYCERGVELLATFRETASGSAPLEVRLGLAAAIDAARAAGAVLVVARRDRLARDPLVSLLIERQVDVLAADGAGNGDDPSAMFQRRILDAVAELERRLIAARTKAALAAKKARGEPLGRAPFGFRHEAGELVEAPEQARVLARMLEASESGMGVRAIAELLNAGGHRTPTGKRFHPTQVARILRRAAA